MRRPATAAASSQALTKDSLSLNRPPTCSLLTSARAAIRAVTAAAGKAIAIAAAVESPVPGTLPTVPTVLQTALSIKQQKQNVAIRSAILKCGNDERRVRTEKDMCTGKKTNEINDRANDADVEAEMNVEVDEEGTVAEKEVGTDVIDTGINDTDIGDDVVL